MEKSTGRKTRQLEVVWHEVAGDNSHPTADQIYQRVRRHIPNISLGTVYRDLRLETVFSPRFHPLCKEAAALLRIASRTLYRPARKGIVLSTRIGIIWRFSRTDLENY